MKRILFILLLLIVWVVNSRAQVPRTISYQGDLRTSQGSAVPDGVRPAYFLLYSSPSDTKFLYFESLRLNFTGGIFSGLIGSVRPIPDSLTFDKQYWLGIEFENHTELTPRIPLTSVPYAIHAGTAGGLSSDFILPAHPIAVSATMSGLARGDLYGSYPAPSVSGIQSRPVLSGSPKKGDMLWWNGNTWSAQPSAVYSSFKVSSHDTQYVKPDSLVVINFNGKSGATIFDKAHDFDPGSNTFIAPVKGYYHFDALLSFYYNAFIEIGLLITDPNSILGVQVFQSTDVEYHNSFELLSGQKVQLIILTMKTSPFNAILLSAEFSGFKIN